MASSFICIQNGKIIDGTGEPGFEGDLLVENGRIVEVGRFSPTPDAEIIDAAGKIVTPGFIDAHCHGDPLETPEFENYLAMGVTTLCLGQDGTSPTEGPLCDWAAKVHEAKTALNIVPFAGHGTLRNQSGIGYSPVPDNVQLKRLRHIAAATMEEGYFGLTFGLEYVPGRVAPFEELVLLAEEVGRANGLIMSHVRSEDDDAVEDAWAELCSQGRDGNCPVHVSHMKVTYGKGRNRAEEVLSVLDHARGEGVRVTGDIYPYTASCTTIGIVFPGWAKTEEDFQEALPKRRDELEDFLRERIKKRGGPDATLLGTEPWTGKTLKEAAEETGKSFEKFLIEDVGPTGADGAYFVMDEELQARLMEDPCVMISSDGHPAWNHPRGYGSFARVIEHFVREKKLFSIEQAIRKMTGLTAETIGLVSQKRGYLKPGHAADVLVFDPDKIHSNADYASPYKLAQGFDDIIINGCIVRRSGNLTGIRPGRVLVRQ